MKVVAAAVFLAEAVHAFPWVSRVPGVDSSMLVARQQPGTGPGSEATCPNNPNHVNAAPVTTKYPYNNALNGKKGNEKGGFRVPAVGDTAHRYIAPTARDIRGPCPGLNTAANHNFLARDGITTYAELVDAQQNVYNVGYDLANLLAFLGLQADGDLVTTKLSIGCDATGRTSFNRALTGSQPGLVGHNKFEGDTSLTRNDFFLGKGDNFRFNTTLFAKMTRSTGANYNLQGLAKYRKERYVESRRDNPNFFFGPLSLLLFGAASFLYELFPSGTRGYAPDFATISSFFVQEKLPDNWTNRVAPYSNRLVTEQIVAMYLLAPVQFGGNTAAGSFNGLPSNFGAIRNGTISPSITPAETSCLLYQLATGQVPSSLNGVVTPTVEALAFFAKNVAPSFGNLGCPNPLT
ncbi:Putative chloroperoxidase [Septoria linicola]|uniref:Chloroperoxidase n=1 Tax=Septoria linicola TaxID=215465 RepID=A0A9Q9EM94_9PEZI|nr:putative chloroperoxidase [Septoria linicola]USW54198.1 Putative chloroperoxidase [Septoria linicola]